MRVVSWRSCARLGAISAMVVLVALAAVAGCTVEPDLSKLPGQYVTSDGKFVLVLRANGTGEMRPDGTLPGTLGAACDPSTEVCREGVCRAGTTSQGYAKYVCKCPAISDGGPTRACDQVIALAPVPLVVQTDPLNRVQLMIDEAQPSVGGGFICWACSLDGAGERFECEHAYPTPSELFPAHCSFARVGSGGLAARDAGASAKR